MVLTVEDIISEMRERPEVRDSIRRVILTDELLELPRRFSELTERVDVLARVTEKNSADIAELKDIVRKNSADIAELSVTVKELVKMTAENTAAIKANAVAIKANAVAIKANAESLKRIEDDMGQYRGLFLEHSMPKLLLPRLAQQLSLKRPRVQYHHNYWPTADYSFMDKVEDACEDGAITVAQESRIRRADMVMNGRRRSDGEEVWIAVEASGLIGEKDIDRAAESAEILATVYKTETHAVVIGHRVSDIDRFRAEQKGVIVTLVNKAEV